MAMTVTNTLEVVEMTAYHLQPANDSTTSTDSVASNGHRPFEDLKGVGLGLSAADFSRLPKLVTDREMGEGTYRVANGHEPECWDGGCDRCELHALRCLCPYCVAYRLKHFGETVATTLYDLFGLVCMSDEDAESLLGAGSDGEGQFTRPITLSATPTAPALLTRDDGETLLYEGRLNSIFGEPGCGKTWLAVWAAAGAAKAGSRVWWWDFEDSPATLATRLQAAGAEDLIGRPDLIRFYVPDLIENESAMAEAVQWVTGGERPGLVVIDSCESAGLAPDSNDTRWWYERYVYPWYGVGETTTGLLVDHVPKRKEDRPAGPIGSQHKLAELKGAGLFMSGTAWTKSQPGSVTLINHKDRPGDLPAPKLKKVAVFNVTHNDDGAMAFHVLPPGKDDGVDVTGDLLHEIAKLGTDGVTGSRKVRALLKAKGTDVDAALEELKNMGFVDRVSAGRAWLYTATVEGMEAVEHGDV